MIVLRRTCFLTRTFDSLHQSTVLHNASKIASPKICDLRFSSKDSSHQATIGCNESVTTMSEEERQLKFIQLEISLLNEKCGRAPDVNLFKKHHWDELLKLKTKSARHKFYNYLFKAEKTKENQAVSGTVREFGLLQLLILPPSEMFF